MSSNLDPSSSIEKILRTLECAGMEAESGWRDGKYSEFKDGYLDNLTTELENLRESLIRLEEFIQLSKESYPLK